MAKNTHTFQNEIKHYNKIRNILRYLYLYDISSLDEFLIKKTKRTAIISSPFSIIFMRKQFPVNQKWIKIQPVSAKFLSIF